MDGTQFLHVSTISTGVVAGKHAALGRVIVGTKLAAAILTIYNGTSVSDPVVAVIDCATSPLSLNFGGIRCPNGIFYGLAGGAADVTITYT